jgi:hypothetical protein
MGLRPSPRHCSTGSSPKSSREHYRSPTPHPSPVRTASKFFRTPQPFAQAEETAHARARALYKARWPGLWADLSYTSLLEPTRSSLWRPAFSPRAREVGSAALAPCSATSRCACAPPATAWTKRSNMMFGAPDLVRYSTNCKTALFLFFKPQSIQSWQRGRGAAR